MSEAEARIVAAAKRYVATLAARSQRHYRDADTAWVPTRAQELAARAALIAAVEAGR